MGRNLFLLIFLSSPSEALIKTVDFCTVIWPETKIVARVKVTQDSAYSKNRKIRAKVIDTSTGNQKLDVIIISNAGKSSIDGIPPSVGKEMIVFLKNKTELVKSPYSYISRDKYIFFGGPVKYNSAVLNKSIWEKSMAQLSTEISTMCK